MPVLETKEGGGAVCVSRDVLDVESYERTVAGIRIEGVRAGRGKGPNHVLSVTNDEFALSSCSVGFPMLNRTTLGDGQIVVAHLDEALPGSRWCDIDLRTGALIAYGPGAEHTALNQPDLNFTFVALDVDLLASMADDAALRLDLPERGEVREIEPSIHTARVGSAFRRYAEDAEQGAEELSRTGLALLSAILLGFNLDSYLRCFEPPCGAIDSRHVVHLCIDYADATQRIPSIPELCLAAHVSERRLRKAFVDEFAVPPSRFFRNWALTAAHRRLQAGRATRVSVTEVATGIGFGHLGRFAAAYQDLYGQPPSETLAASGAAGGESIQER